MTATCTLVPLGPFSLREAAAFGFGPRVAAAAEPVMRLAFCVDGLQTQAGVLVRQDPTGIHLEIHSDAPAEAVTAQVARMLSLDHDGRPFVEAGRRDPVLGRLQALHPGLRPPLFASPYEAAVWAVLSQRRSAAVARPVRTRIAERLGATFELGGERLAALPTPEALLRVEVGPGLDEERVVRLHGVARAALAGDLDPERLQARGAEGARASALRLRGIGPFWAELVAVRATGFADVVPTHEPRVLGLAGELYDLGGPATAAQLEELAEDWRPLRTWGCVLVRAAGADLLAERRLSAARAG